MLPVIRACTAANAAYTSSAAVLTTALDNTKPPGGAVYQLLGTTALYWAQGINDTTFTANVNDELTAVSPAAHGLALGDAVQVSTTVTLPTGLAATTTYFAITSDALGAAKFKLATTRALALAGTAIDITGAGSGTHTVTTIATAGAGSHLLALGAAVYVDGSNGPKISVIRASADGNASVAAISVAR